MKKIALSFGAETGASLDHDRLDELVRHGPVVARLDGGDGIRRRRPSINDRVERALRALPTTVAIHGVVAAADGGDAFGRQLGQVVDRGVRGDITSVRERMDPGFLGREAQQRAQVVDVGVDAAVGDEAE